MIARPTPVQLARQEERQRAGIDLLERLERLPAIERSLASLHEKLDRLFELQQAPPDVPRIDVLRNLVAECARLVVTENWIQAAAHLYFELPNRLARPPQVQRVPLGAILLTLTTRDPRNDIRRHLELAGVDEKRLHEPSQEVTKIAQLFPVRSRGATLVTSSDVAEKLLREVLIGYGFPKSQVQKSWLKHLRVPAAGAE